MPELNIFEDEAFSTISLTKAINTSPEGQRVPTLLDALFEEEGIRTTSLFIERDNDSLALVPARDRGAPADVTVGTKRDKVPFQTFHLPTRAAIMADEVQGIRAFGSETELEAVQDLVNKRLAKMRRRIEATIRFQRAGALTGKILDADGTTELLDLFARFGLTQQTQNMVLGTSTTKVLQKIIDAKRKAEDAIGDSGVITGWLAVCGRSFFDDFANHDATEKAFDRWQDGQFLREDKTRTGFMFGGVEWQEYYGKVGGVDFIDTNVAYLVPLGVEGLFATNYAPADYMETVNTVGVPFYASQEPMPHNKGIDMEAQSNPVSICTRPRAVIKLTKS
ncbi:major capsid protein [Pseudomonas indica]|uniref:major capsid protein n=1 Tax=Pseudomonas indica TaxID=137658 RepID=UPI003FD3EAAD